MLLPVTSSGYFHGRFRFGGVLFFQPEKRIDRTPLVTPPCNQTLLRFWHWYLTCTCMQHSTTWLLSFEIKIVTVTSAWYQCYMCLIFFQSLFLVPHVVVWNKKQQLILCNILILIFIQSQWINQKYILWFSDINYNNNHVLSRSIIEMSLFYGCNTKLGHVISMHNQTNVACTDIGENATPEEPTKQHKRSYSW